MSVYFLLDIFAMFAGAILLRHDPEAAVPLQNIGWNLAFCLADNSNMVKPKRSLTLGDGLYTQYHPIPNYDVFLLLPYWIVCFPLLLRMCQCLSHWYLSVCVSPLLPFSDSIPIGFSTSWFLYTLPFASPPLHNLLSSPPHL